MQDLEAERFYDCASLETALPVVIAIARAPLQRERLPSWNNDWYSCEQERSRELSVDWKSSDQVLEAFIPAVDIQERGR